MLEEHYPVMLRYARKLCQDDDEAYEIVHDVVVKANMEGKDFVRSYLNKLVYCVFLDRRRLQKRPSKSKNWTAPLDIDDVVIPFAASQLVELELSQMIDRINELPAIDRETFTALIWGEMTLEEIASQQGVTRSAVGQRIGRIRKKIGATK